MEETASASKAQTGIQVTVFTGYLGAGKTTIIFDLIKRLGQAVPGYKVALLKNEFGDVKVDSLLASESSIKVTEMLNGCLCCVLVGQMKNALQEIKEAYNPDRIIIESSGSAFPAPIAWQIRQIEPDFHLDSIVTVIDAVNFRGYEDTSYTAKMQAQYTDLILLNKHELVTERELDLVLDHVYELNEDTPKVKYASDLDLDLLFGLDTQLFSTLPTGSRLGEIKVGGQADDAHGGIDHMKNEVDLLTIEDDSFDGTNAVPLAAWDEFLGKLSKDTVYRVKGLVRVVGAEDGAEPYLVIVNHAFGRTAITKVESSEIMRDHAAVRAKLTVMGTSLFVYKALFAKFFGAAASVKLHVADHH
ncbi:hypothetical protein H9P43_002929 [Blastocladiella emersonii ATCC 22665]|nr:hypothetical protein H9P43_002929 [Blastocladiella emersonii ATCC 22665]